MTVTCSAGFASRLRQLAEAALGMNETHEVRHDKAGGLRVGLGWHISKGKNGDTYELAPGFNTVITREGKQLFCQATGQSK
jgi:hypothetical protein